MTDNSPTFAARFPPGVWLARPPVLSFFAALAALLLVMAIGTPAADKTPAADDAYFDADDETAETAPPPPPIAVLTPADAPPPPPAWLEYRIRRGDTMERVLKSIKADPEMREFLLAQKLKSYRRLKIGDDVYFRLDDAGKLRDLLYKTSPEYYLTAGRDAAGKPWAKEEPPVLTPHRRRVAGRVDSSLFVAADKAGMSESAINKLIEALEAQIDFYRDVRKNDSFRAVYEEWLDDNETPVKVGDILAFEYDNRHPSRPRVIRGVLGEDGYYTPKGESLQRAFLPAPLKYRRISSKFSPRRFHPVLKRWRPHRGVDYAAKTGTPVHSTADGVIFKVARERGYGNVVMIKHFNIYTTVYAHLSRFAKGVRKNKRVRQGEVIGYVGQTGLATGPHLHYEFRLRNVHKDPLSLRLPRQLPPLTGEKLAAFQQQAAPLLAELQAIPLASLQTTE